MTLAFLLTTISLCLAISSSAKLSSTSSTSPTRDLAPTIYLPYTSAFSSFSTPTIRGSINGIPFAFPIDTGSTGLMIGAPLLPYIHLDASSTTHEPGWQFLSSSSLLYTGRFVPLNITFHGAARTTAVSTVPVLVVHTVLKCPGYDSSLNTGVCPSGQSVPSNANISHVTYMGVGFGRNVPGSGIAFGTPSHNPFLNVVSVNRRAVPGLRTGYTVSTNGVYLGLTWWNTRGAVWTGLQRGVTGDSRDWAMLDMAFKVDGLDGGEFRGKALVDTGVAQMYLQSAPLGSLPNVSLPVWEEAKIELKERVKPETHLEFAFPDFENGVAGYDFEVGDRRFPSQPLYVEPVTSGEGPFVNTGREFLWGFTVAFDAVVGRFGFICARCMDDRNFL